MLRKACNCKPSRTPHTQARINRVPSKQTALHFACVSQHLCDKLSATVCVQPDEPGMHRTIVFWKRRLMSDPRFCFLFDRCLWHSLAGCGNCGRSCLTCSTCIKLIKRYHPQLFKDDHDTTNVLNFWAIKNSTHKHLCFAAVCPRSDSRLQLCRINAHTMC